MSAGRKLLSSLVYGKDANAIVGLSIFPEMFKEGELTLYEFIMGHVHSFGAIPTEETIEDKLGDVLMKAPEPVEFYLAETEKRYLQGELKKVAIGIQDNLQGQDPEKALHNALNRISELSIKQKRRSIIDFRDAADLIHAEYVAVKQMSDAVGVMFGWPTLDNMTGGLKGGDLCSIVGRPASGKAQPLSAKVLTPTGWTTMGQLSVGSALASLDGDSSTVTAIYPQGPKPVFKVTFQDGRSTEAADEHLWEVWYREWEAPRVVTTVQLAAMLTKKRYQRRLSVRLFGGDYGVELSTLVSPYVLGLLIGDGCFRGGCPSFASEDSELVEAVRSGVVHLGLQVIHADRCNYRICGDRTKVNALKEWLKNLGLWGLKSEKKHLPPWVFRMSKAQRQGLLQGLMDSDGTACKAGGVSFATSSPQLAKDVQRLVWSLGGRATINQKKTKSLLAYILHVVFEDRASSFRLERKRSRVDAERTTHTNTRLRIESVEFVRTDECQCISVSHSTKLYVTDEYIMTHNTFMGLYTALHGWQHTKQLPLFVSMEMTNLAITQRLAAMNSHKPLTQLLKGMLTSKSYLSMYNLLLENKQKDKPFWCVDGNLTANVDDLVMLCHQLHPSSVWVDGAYLLRHPNPRLGRWDRMTENAEGLKQRIATDLKTPVVASYQFSKEVSKKKKKGDDSKTGSEDIYGSDAVAQLSSVILGLFEEDTVETEIRRKINVLKGRNGEKGEFIINWNFHGMDFSEIASVKDEKGNTVPDTSGLQFLG